MSSAHLHWSSFKKVQARKETIVDSWSKMFSFPVPKNKQYWTLCGSCIDESGKSLLPNCEIDQLCKSGLITVSQFHGVNYDSGIISGNKRVAPEAHWHRGDFRQVMKDENVKGRFNPAIVNADFTSMPATVCNYFSDLLLSLSYVKSDMMVVCNMILEHQNVKKLKKDMDFVIKSLNDNDGFQMALRIANWESDDYWYRYNGTGDKMSTVMGTLIFYKRRNENEEIV